MYGCRYEDVEPDEALDLVLTLPPGSLFVRAVRPDLAWAPERHLAADIIDSMWAVAWARAGADGEPPRVDRPGDAEARRREAERAARVRERMERTSWKEA